MKLLIIRPQLAADKTAQLAAHAGMEPSTMPLFELHPVAWEMLPADNFDGLLVTSANALRNCGDVGAGVKELPLLAVGETTAETARQLGYDVKLVGTSGKAELLTEARKRGFANILWLAGKHRTVSHEDDGIISNTVSVYESRAVPPPSDFPERIENIDVVALHSSRAAQHFGALVTKHGVPREDISIAALSSKIAEQAGSGWRDVVIAKTPDDAALLLAAQSLAR